MCRAIFVAIDRVDLQALVVLSQIIGTELIEPVPNSIDAGPSRFVPGQPMLAQLSSEETPDLARGVSLDLVVRKVVTASGHFRSQICRKCVDEGRALGPSQGRHKFCEQSGLIE